MTWLVRVGFASGSYDPGPCGLKTCEERRRRRAGCHVCSLARVLACCKPNYLTHVVPAPSCLTILLASGLLTKTSVFSPKTTYKGRLFFKTYTRFNFTLPLSRLVPIHRPVALTLLYV